MFEKLKILKLFLVFEVLLVSFVSLTFCYNLNTLHAIIYQDAHINLNIHAKSSYFGYTTALFRGKSKPWIFIGAPRGIDLSLPCKNPGVVFKCGIKQSCDIVTLDKDGRDNAWIGGTMELNPESNFLSICGFRWTMEIPHMIGACYVSKAADKLNFKRILPLYHRSKYVFEVSRITSVYNYALGQAGFSAHFTKDRQNPNLLLGAPGVLNWYGGTILTSNLSSLSTPSPLIKHKVTGQQDTAFGLFGYAVSSGHYTDKNHELYASSAPKGNNYQGTVVIYKFAEQTDRLIEKKHILSGTQMGEYFGAALASGDLNNDGYDDLIIGAPFYSERNFNDGRIHVYYGGKERNSFVDANSVVRITGSNDGGHFGTAITFLGDLNLDGFGDIAVGEPFSDAKHGIVYIYHGGPYGLVTTPAQILHAKDIDDKFRGFGISISKAVDIDRNGYKDIAIGAHLSGHAAVIRSNPLIEIDSSLNILNGTKINIIENTTLRHCYTHLKNPYIPNHITIRRKLIIDENYQRVILAPPTKADREFLLNNKCEVFVLTTKDILYYLTEPVKISVHYELVQEPMRKSNVYVGVNNTDTFCKTCPVLLNVRPLEAEFSFALACGDDDVCVSNLSFDAKFFDLENNTFVIGSTDIIRMEILVGNSGDSAYLTQVFITLPMYVRFNSIPRKCSENEQGMMVCDVGNPLQKQMYLSIPLNMKDVRTDHGPNLTISINVTTTSMNKNQENHKQFTLKLKNVVDLKLSGKSEPAVNFYAANSTFRQVFEIQKHGHSPADQVSLTIFLPTHIVKNQVAHSIVKIFSIVGSLRGQPLLCKNHSEVEYIREDLNEIESIDVDESPQVAARLLRDVNLVYSNNLENFNETNNSVYDFQTLEDDGDDLEEDFFNLKVAQGKIVTIDCRDADSLFQCTKFTCDVGTIKMQQDVAVVRIKALLDIIAIKKVLKIENNILLNSYGHVSAFFEIDAISNNDVNITSTFSDKGEFRLDMWILLCATLAGLILLIILTFALYKLGFFTRAKKLQLEEEKKQAITEEFNTVTNDAEDKLIETNTNQMNDTEIGDACL